MITKTMYYTHRETSRYTTPDYVEAINKEEADGWAVKIFEFASRGVYVVFEKQPALPSPSKGTHTRVGCTYWFWDWEEEGWIPCQMDHI